MPKNEIILREFKYFDRQIVEDFLSSIEGGLATESKRLSTKKGSIRGAEVGPSFLRAKVEMGTEDISNEEKKTMGDAALFQRLYAALDNYGMINRSIKHQVERDSVYEFEGNIELPFFEIVSEVSHQINPLISQATTDAKRDNVLNILAQNQTVHVRVLYQNSKVSLMGVLQKRNLRVPIQELADEYKGLYRIKRVLKPNEVFDVFKLPVKLNSQMIDDILKNSNNMPSEGLSLLGINKQLSREDFQMKYPALILTPIAIYQ
ncbi:MAG: DUF6414 family protein [Candidatus Bathyarchaeia archaeon]